MNLPADLTPNPLSLAGEGARSRPRAFSLSSPLAREGEGGRGGEVCGEKIDGATSDRRNQVAPMRSAVSAAVLALAILAPARASAYENQWHAGADAGYVGGWNGVGSGVGAGIDLGYGVRDWLDVTGSVDVSYHPASRFLVPSATAGVRFVFDVLQVVPYVGAMGGVAGRIFAGTECTTVCSAARLDLALPFGADYQLSRSFTIGAAGRFQVLLLNGSPTPMLGAFAKVQYVWGY